MKKKTIRKIGSALCAAVVCASLLAGCGAAPGAAGTQSAGEGSGAAAPADTQGAEESGSGAVQKLNTTMGRYMEEEAALPEGLGTFAGITMEGNRLRLSSKYGMDVISDDGGISFNQDGQVPAAFMSRAMSDYFTGIAVTPEGHRLTAAFKASEDERGKGAYTVRLMQPNGEEKEITDLSSAGPVTNLIYGQNGYFYLSCGKDMEHNVYQIDPVTGETLYLFTADEMPGMLAMAGTRLYAGLEGKLQVFDLETKEMGEDPVLEEFLKPYLTGYSFQETLPFLICQGTDEDSLYVAVRDGLYRHVIGGSVMEQVIDGNLCSIGDISKLYVGMTAVQENGVDVFYILFFDGRLMRYTFDASQPTVPDTILRIYSLYENENIRLAVNAYQAEHPGLYVKYEIGAAEESGQTREDALKTLSTELAAGKGPDVIVLDDLPYESYAEKGVLADLTGLVSEINGEGLFEKMLDPFRSDGKLFAAPTVFSVPVICGKADMLPEEGGLDGLVRSLETARAGKADGGLIGGGSPRRLLELLSAASANAWVREDGSLDRDAVTEFLTQCRKIYEIETSGAGVEAGAEETNGNISEVSSGRMRRIAQDRINVTLNTAVYLSEPFALGNLSGTPNDLAWMLSLLELNGMDYRLMPGQGGKVFSPSGLLSVNSAGMYREQAEAFVKFMLSAGFQSEADLNGAPVCRAAFEAKKEFPFTDRTIEEPIMHLVSSDESGNVQSLEVRWPKAEQFEAFTQLAESLDTCGTGVGMVRDAVLELGAAAVTGDRGIEETVDEIEKKVRLYLAE